MKVKIKIILIYCLSFALTSCVSYSFQKKRFSKGYYISKTSTKSGLIKSNGIASRQEQNKPFELKSSSKEIINQNEFETTGTHNISKGDTVISFFPVYQTAIKERFTERLKGPSKINDFKRKKVLLGSLQKKAFMPNAYKRIVSLESTVNFKNVIYFASATLCAVLMYYIVLLPIFPQNMAILLAIGVFFFALLLLYIDKNINNRFNF